MLRHTNAFILQLTIEGDSDITADKLKKITKYYDCDESYETIKRFWRVLGTFDNRLMKLYLKYVFGRTTLSQSTRNYHSLAYFSNRRGIPETHTCFFELDIGEYDSDEDFRQKLVYGMENCHFIAENGGQYVFDEEDVG